MLKTTVAVLRAAVQAANLAVEQRNTIPILGSILVKASSDSATLTTTNMEQRIAVQLSPVECDGQMTFTLRAKPLLASLKLAKPDDVVIITAEKLQTKIEVGGFNLALAALDSDDFPTPNDEDDNVLSFNIKAGELRRIIGSVVYCASTEETRYYLNGVSLQVVDDTFAAVATDGHRLMLATTILPAGARKWKGGILPTKMVSVLRDFLRNVQADDNVRVTAGVKKFRVDYGTAWSVATKMIDGVFPEYGKVIPAKKNDAAHLVIADPKAFVHAIQQIRSVSLGRSTPVVFGAASGGGVKLTVDQDGDKAVIRLDDATAYWQDKKIERDFGFQARYLIAAAVGFPAGFTMQVLDENAPCRMEGKEGLAVLMPMRV